MKIMFLLTISAMSSTLLSAQTQPEATGAAIVPADQIDFLPEKFNNKVLFKEENFNLILFALLKGQEIPEHKTPRNAYLQCLEGKATVTIGGIAHTLKKGEIILLPKDASHSVKALKKTKLMLLK